MNKTTIIAEVGINHNGNFSTAKRYIRECKKINVDIVKFQIAIPQNVVIKSAKKAKYQKLNQKDNQSQLDMIKKLHLRVDEYLKLVEYANKKKIEIMFSAFDIESLQIILKLKSIKTIKIPSGEITNKPYLQIISKSKKNVILSTGMSNLKEIKTAIRLLDNNKISILHCSTSYPTEYKDVNLRVIDTLKENFNLPVGYSDHTIGFEVPIAAVARGATIIEKHITFNRRHKGPDHKASMNFEDFSNLIKYIRNIEKSIGNREKKISKSELSNKTIVRKSIFAKQDIKKGELFSWSNLCIKRPGNGVSPMLIDKYLGKKSKFNYKTDDKIK